MRSFFAMNADLFTGWDLPRYEL